MNPGDTIRYTIIYRNDGNADASEVVIESLVDQELSANGNRSENRIGWPLDTVAPGSEGAVHFDVILSNAFLVETQRFAAQLQ